jgi:uncharacterized protein YciU (UPF0263 family)
VSITIPGFFPEHANDTGVEFAVDWEERVDVAVDWEERVEVAATECDQQEELEHVLEFGRRHRDRIEVERNANRSTN